MYEPKIQTKTLQNEVMIETGFFFFKKSTMYNRGQEFKTPRQRKAARTTNI